jgi:hypothetical protein
MVSLYIRAGCGSFGAPLRTIIETECETSDASKYWEGMTNATQTTQLPIRFTGFQDRSM